LRHLSGVLDEVSLVVARQDKNKIHQFHSGSSVADAVTNCMFFVQSMLQSFSFESDIFVEHVDTALSGRIRRLEDLRVVESDLLLIHHSMGHDAFAARLLTAALLRELDRIIAEDRYPLSARIRTLKAIRAKIRPERERGPLPPPKQYAPPRAAASRRRRYGRRAGEISPAHLGRAVARRIAPELCSKHTGQAGEEFEPLVVLAKCLIVGR
jgi:hypothetical protein